MMVSDKDIDNAFKASRENQYLRSQKLKGILRKSGELLEGAPSETSGFVVDQKIINEMFVGDETPIQDVYRLPARKAIRGKFHGFQEVVTRDDNIVLIYQMGKVGSSSIFTALCEEKIGIPVYQLHYLKLDHLKSIRNWYLNKGIDVIPGHVTVATELSSFLSKYKKDLNWKVISIMRDPIAMQVSSIFENMKGYANELKVNDEGFDVADYRQKVIDNLSGFKNENHHFMNWFKEELGDVFGVNIFQENNMNKSEYFIIKQGNVEVLLLKFENIADTFSPAMGEFMGVEGIELARSNISDQKSFGQQYKAFVQAMKLPKKLCDEIYSTEVVKFFYTPAEIEAFKHRWSEEF